jgi:hypothetical protein
LSKSQLQTNNSKLSALITELQGKAAGGGSGGGLETCQVTIRQEWGMNDDPEYLYLYVTAYNVENGVAVPYYELFNSAYDYEPSHTITLTMYKNVPFAISSITKFMDASNVVTVTSTGGQLARRNEANPQYVMYQLIPTSDNATFTFASP